MKKTLYRAIITNKIAIIIFIILFGIFFLNTFHEEYPDEYDSIVGGLYITQGKIPYRQWFQHHNPGAYVVSAFLLTFSGRSFVRFRIFLACAFFILNIGLYFLIRKRTSKDNSTFYLFYLFFLAFSATYFWGQMLLADTLAAYLLVPAYAFLAIKTIKKERFTQKDLVFISLCIFFSWFTSMTYTFIVAGLSLYALFLYILGERKTGLISFIKYVCRGMLVLAAPYIIFILYLVLTKSLQDYYFANIYYNDRFYIYNYPRLPGAPLNPIRYAIVIARNFFDNYLPALAGVAGLPFSNSLQTTLALSNAVFFVILFLTRQYTFIIPFLLMLIYSNARSNPQTIRETDYQSIVYVLSSAFNGIYALHICKNLLDKGKQFVSEKIITSFLFIILVIFWFFTAYYVPLKFFQKFYAKYMGEAPLIYDRPQIAQVLNKITDKSEYAWVGPFEFKELFYMNAQVPSRYHWFLQHAAHSKIKDEIIEDFIRNKPKVIVFLRHYAPWGGDPKGFNWFFTDYLDKNYFRIYELNDESKDYKYIWALAPTQNFDFEKDFNFDRSRKDEIIDELIEKGLVLKTAK